MTTSMRALLQRLLFGLFLFCLITQAIADTQDRQPTEPKKGAAEDFQLLPELISGVIAGVFTCVIFYPLECLEARMQVAPAQKDAKAAKPGPVTAAKLLLAQEGVAGFYKGLTPTLLGSMVNWGLYFGIYQYMNFQWKQSHKPSALGNLYAAVVAGFFCTIIVNPFWVLKIRLATSNKYTGMGHALRSIIKNEGFGGLWKGTGISLVGISEGAVQFVAYEQLKLISGTSVGGQLFSGGTARLIAGLITYPYLLLRAALQAQGCPYTSLTDAIQKIYAREGLGGFYRGMAPNLIRNVPPAACMLFLVERIRVSPLLSALK